MDADHYGWIFACLLLISPVLFLFVPMGYPATQHSVDTIIPLDPVT
jgi:hypothetical protein